MIEWMQKHRKYLVITIWISTIAFVGAGFVGWGAYSFNKSSSSIAKVGNRDVSLKELQQAYSTAYNNYNNMLGGNFTKEKAKELHLEQMVITNLINETLLLNYADDLGLKALDEDVENELKNEKAFQVDGTFNINAYNRVLRNIGTKPTDYENGLRRTILLQKVSKVLDIPAKKELVQAMGSINLIQDKISTKTISVLPDSIKVSDEELKKFWGPIKDNFKTIKSYDIVSEFIPSKNITLEDKELKEFYEESKYNYTDKDGKIKKYEDAKEEASKALKIKKAKKIALKKYLKIKNKEDKLTKNETIKNTNKSYPIDQLTTANPNDVLKPFRYNDGYKVVQLIKTNLPKPKSFKQAKIEVENIYKAKKANEELVKKAKDELHVFKANDAKYVSRDIKKPINGLTLQESRLFVNQMFDINKNKNYIVLGNKAVIYEITEQKLLDNKREIEMKKELTKVARELQNNQIMINLLSELRKQYKIEQYYKGN